MRKAGAFWRQHRVLSVPDGQFQSFEVRKYGHAFTWAGWLVIEVPVEIGFNDGSLLRVDLSSIK